MQSTLPYEKKTTGWLIFIHLGCLLAPFTFTWQGFWTWIILYGVIGGLGIALCFHRLLSHRSFKTPKWVEYFLTIIGCLAAQRSPIFWVATHRKHHAFSDTERDPHSPRDGFLWAHMIWPMKEPRPADENEYYKKFAPDLAADPGHRWIQKTHELWPILLAVTLFVAGGLPLLEWGFFVTLATVYHGTWFVNSLGHIWGYRNYRWKDDSQNNPIIAFFAFGDGWHNNHHAYPALAHHGFHKPWEFDLAFVVIKIMGFLGLASNIRTLTKKEVQGEISEAEPKVPTEPEQEPELTNH